ncbi:MAG TPA: di-heme oxidoredictase family protein [Polyangiaceae bacterium]|nr:di-heme oxidoredictase family protein [Polyangiaceae bacterium]
MAARVTFGSPAIFSTAKRREEIAFPILLATSLFAAACSGSGPNGGAVSDASAAGKPTENSEPGVRIRDVAIAKISSELSTTFNDGDYAFDLPMHDADGLGPLYTRVSCSACHDAASRGPGMVQKMSVVEDDRVTPSPDQSLLPWGHTVHPQVAGGGKTPIVPPTDPSVLVTSRLGPPILGRGYMEAIEDSEIERVEMEQAARSDQIHGRINHVTYESEMSADAAFHTHVKGDAVIGRFGLKARIATLDDFTADAFQNDMGITSPLRPNEITNPDGLLDDDKPGIDVDLDSIQKRAMYVRLIAIPTRIDDAIGRKLFDQVQCSACHVPTMHTRADYPIAQLADIDAPVYTDMLLHQMGPALADGLPEDPSVDWEASSRQWRTMPLIGVSLNHTFLHDGRVTTVEDAILAHGGDGSEASDSLDQFNALSDDDRKHLIAFVEGL